MQHRHSGHVLADHRDRMGVNPSHHMIDIAGVGPGLRNLDLGFARCVQPLHAVRRARAREPADRRIGGDRIEAIGHALRLGMDDEVSRQAADDDASHSSISRCLRSSAMQSSTSLRGVSASPKASWR